MGRCKKAARKDRATPVSVVRLVRLFHAGLEINPETVGDAVDVVEERDDLGCIADGEIGKPGGAQPLHVRSLNPRRRARELHRMIAERPIDRRKLGRRIVALDSLNPIGVVDLSTEVEGVCLRSVVTAVGFGNDDRHHLALRTRQW